MKERMKEQIGKNEEMRRKKERTNRKEKVGTRWSSKISLDFEFSKKGNSEMIFFKNRSCHKRKFRDDLTCCCKIETNLFEAVE